MKAACDSAEEHAISLRTIELKVTNTTSANAAIAQIVRESGQLDVIVHNAGHMCYGPAESFTPEQMSTYYYFDAVGSPRIIQHIMRLHC